MNKIEKLINELCPDDVEFKELGEVCEIKTGQLVSKVLIDKNPGEFPVINSGKKPLGFINKFNTENNPIGITSRGAGVGSLTYCEGKYFRGNLNYSVTILNKDFINVRFLFHILINNKIGIQELCSFNGIPALNASKLKIFKIPIPPLPIQQEIVKILDNFTQLEAELEAELEARKRQYEYYRDEMLSFGEEVEWKELGEAGEIIGGSGMPKVDFTESGIGCIHYGQIYTYYGADTKKTKSFVSEKTAKKLKKVNYGNIIIAKTSENVEDLCKSVVYLGKDEIVTGGHTAIFKHNQVPKFIGYYINGSEKFQIQKRKYTVGTKVKDISLKNIKKFKIPIPSLEKQEEIVRVLDKFDKLVNDISEGLPAEIEARRQQYEYYRGKLLDFKEFGKTSF